MTSIPLEIDVRSDASDAVRDLGAIGDAARGMADQVEAAAREADNAVSRVDKIGASAEGLDDKAGKATGALGALAAGFELVGAEKYAGALEGAAMATDFFSGVGQSAMLILETTRGATLKAAIASRAHAAADRARAVASNLATAAGRRALVTSAASAVATRAAAAATRAYAVAQRILNAVLRANPIGLVITAIMLLVAGVVLAYKRSETFRRVVDGAMKAARTAIGWVVDKVSNLVEWFRDRAPRALRTMRDTFDRILGGVADFFSPITTAISNVIDAVQDLIGWIGKIKFPKVPDLNPFSRGRSAGPGAGFDPAGFGPPPAGSVVYAPVIIQGAIDPAGTARQVRTLLGRDSRRTGGLVLP